MDTGKYGGHPDDLDIFNQRHTPARRLGALVLLPTEYSRAEGGGTRLSFCHYFPRNIIHTEYIYPPRCARFITYYYFLTPAGVKRNSTTALSDYE